MLFFEISPSSSLTVPNSNFGELSVTSPYVEDGFQITGSAVMALYLKPTRRLAPVHVMVRIVLK